MEDVMEEFGRLVLVSNAPAGVKRREGLQFVAEFGSPIEKLEFRRGRLCAYSDGLWHIVPTPPTADKPSKGQ